ncbi:hypothetical protein AMELA_G00274320 [Ameiurus melas]|uniref:Uncharacterized protein n=1 Tax=Ameiurus melas TaxID=219545 RepID=A0A7J5ZPI1_AMEME|nr:hypothetical protein AMELA_G00274320 [Ameiurus melas]
MGQVLAVLQVLTRLTKILHCDCFVYFCINLNKLGPPISHSKPWGCSILQNSSIFVSFLALSYSALNLPVYTLPFKSLDTFSHSSEGEIVSKYHPTGSGSSINHLLSQASEGGWTVPLFPLSRSSDITR